jgi:hypothetical protein
MVIDMNDEPWSAAWLPDLPQSVATFPRKINDDGDILLVGIVNGQYVPYVYNPGLYPEAGPDAAPTVFPFAIYDVSNIDMSFPPGGSPPQFAGVLPGGNATFHYTLGDAAPQTFAMPAAIVFSINGNGTFCGRYSATTIGKGGKATTTQVPFHFNPEMQASPTVLGDAGLSYPLDIDDSDDVVTFGKYLVHSGAGKLDLNALVVGSASDVTYFRQNAFRDRAHLTERDSATGFPVIGTRVGDAGCLLTPLPPP